MTKANTVIGLAVTVLLALALAMWFTRGVVVIWKTSSSFTTLDWENGGVIVERFQFARPAQQINTVDGGGGEGHPGRVFRVEPARHRTRWGVSLNARASDYLTDMIMPAGTGESVWFPLWPIRVALLGALGLWVVGLLKARRRGQARGFEVGQPDSPNDPP